MVSELNFENLDWHSSKYHNLWPNYVFTISKQNNLETLYFPIKMRYLEILTQIS